MNTSPSQLAYTPADPTPGIYLIRILQVKQDANYIYITYDIAVGPSAGWAHSKYLLTGYWLLQMRFPVATNNVTLTHLLQAAGVASLQDLIGCLVCAEIDYVSGNYETPFYCLRRSYPPEHYHIHPDDIRVGTTNWAAGSSDTTRATYIAQLSGLPVICADARERQSPMVDWCAIHQIAILPMVFPVGDYTAPTSAAIVDRKQSISELYNNFSCSTRHTSYDIAASAAAALGKRLIYVVGTEPADNVRCIADLAEWKSTIPRVGEVSGKNLSRNIRVYKRLHTNTDFIFVNSEELCEEIYRQLSSTKSVEEGELR